MSDQTDQNLTNPQAMVDAALGSAPVAQTDDTPLAFVAPPVQPVPPTPPAPSFVPPVVPPSVPPAPAEVLPQPKSQSKIFMVIGGIFALLSMLGIGGYYAYQQMMPKQPAQIAVVGRDQASCNGCLNGGWMVWRNGECKVTGICDSGVPGKDTQPPDTTDLTQAECNSAGGVWCEATDLNKQSYGFCNATGLHGVPANTCNNLAAKKGYAVLLGSVEGLSCQCATADQNPCTSWQLAESDRHYYDAYPGVLDKVNALCDKGKGTINFGNGAYICKNGVKGGTTIYSGGACTADNGKPFNGNLGCFCGTVQVDTGTGHTSYSSTCGCDKNTDTHKVCDTKTYQCKTVSGAGKDTCAGDKDCQPNAPVLACTGLSRTPVTESPTIGTTLTFTCAGTISPASAGTLSYKFKYSLNDGSDQLLPNKTATTAELTISACGTYSVQCKVCATIAGVLKCDPTWTGAIQ